MTQTLPSTNVPIAIAPGEGPKYWLVGDQLTFKVDGERTGGAYALAENYGIPQQGPPPHIHHREDECFYVIDGTMMFGYGDAAFTGGPGTAVYLKKGIPHCFKNVGETPAKFLVLATPAGFDRFAAECGECIPQIPFEKQVGKSDVERLLSIVPTYGIELCPDWKPTAPPPAPRKDRKLWVLGQLVTIKLSTQETGGALSLVEVTSRPGQGVPAHRHRTMSEMFYVLAGEWEFTLEGQPRRATPGTLVHVPAGALHAFRNVGPTPATLLNYHLPGGFDAFFEEAGIEATDEANPPEIALPPMEEIAALFDRHGMDLPRP